jgi:hypothetical protein
VLIPGSGWYANVCDCYLGKFGSEIEAAQAVAAHEARLREERQRMSNDLPKIGELRCKTPQRTPRDLDKFPSVLVPLVPHETAAREIPWQEAYLESARRPFGSLLN